MRWLGHGLIGRPAHRGQPTRARGTAVGAASEWAAARIGLLGQSFCQFPFCPPGSVEHAAAVPNGVAGQAVGDRSVGVGGSLQKPCVETGLA
jgi:hypothetical protein